MPYEVNAVTEQERSRVYKTIWIGFAATPIAIAARLLDFQNIFTSVCLGFAIGGYLTTVFSNRTDDYFNSLCAVGHRFVAGFLCLYLFSIFIGELYDFSYSLGRSLTDEGIAVREVTGLFGHFSDGPLIALFTLLVFYLGYAFARLRG